MIDLHTHTTLSDGAVLPSELVRRAEISGYKAIALTDHVDSGNMKTVLKQLVGLANDLNSTKCEVGINVLPGVEITHMPPSLIPDMAKQQEIWAQRSWWCMVKHQWNRSIRGQILLLCKVI